MILEITVFILGAAIGSFLNVCICRLPRGESIAYPASYCPHCKHRLNVADLIPILSFILLKAKCRYCRKPISFRYPLVEFLCGLLFVLALYKFLIPLDVIFALVFVSLLVGISFIDLEQQVIPDVLSYSGIALGLLYHLLKRDFFSALAGMVLGYLILYSIAFVGKLIFKKEAMGEGDFFLAAMLGACLGWQGLILSLFLAYLVAAALALIFLLLGKVKMGQYIPFGPALAAGGLLTLFWGRLIVAFYLGMVF